MADREQRVEDALQQLIFRLLPSDPDEDEAVEEQRFDDGLSIARDILGRHDPFYNHLFLFACSSTRLRAA